MGMDPRRRFSEEEEEQDAEDDQAPSRDGLTVFFHCPVTAGTCHSLLRHLQKAERESLLFACADSRAPYTSPRRKFPPLW